MPNRYFEGDYKKREVVTMMDFVELFGGYPTTVTTRRLLESLPDRMEAERVENVDPAHVLESILMLDDDNAVAQYLHGIGITRETVRKVMHEDDYVRTHNPTRPNQHIGDLRRMVAAAVGNTSTRHVRSEVQLADVVVGVILSGSWLVDRIFEAVKQDKSALVDRLRSAPALAHA